MMTTMLRAAKSAAMASLLFTFCLLLLSIHTLASSTRDPPLKRFAHISDVNIEVVSRDHNTGLVERGQRHVQHLDRLRLSFRAFEQLFHLHLEPTEDLVPENGAHVRYVSLDPATGDEIITRTETVYREDVRAYRGVVVHSDYTHQRLLEDRVGVRRDLPQQTESDLGVMGPASLVLHDDGLDSSTPARFEGSFTWAGNEHTIQLPLNYETSRSEHDPLIQARAIAESSPIIHRMSDRMTAEEEQVLNRRDTGLTSSGCHADEYNFNQNTMKGMASPLSFFALPRGVRLGKRNDAAFSLPHWLGGYDDSLAQGTADSSSTPLNSFDVRSPAYSYEAALAKRQDDALGGDNNDSFTSSIGSTQGCPNAPRVVYIGMASDCTYTGRFANDTDVRVQILTLMNTVSNIYRSTFKVALGVVDIEVRDASACSTTATGNNRWNQACSDSYTLDQRLSDFSAWRGNMPANGTGLWHLLTGCSAGSEVGVAWLGTLCKTDTSQSGGTSVTGAGVSAVTQREAQVVSHEIGHNFGAIHDCTTGCSLSGQTARQSNGAVCCPQTTTSCDTSGMYIMSPVSETDTQSFSPCSVGNICSMLGRGLDTSCVIDPTQSQRETLSIQQCGNGILEPGEECDAGTNGSNCCTSSCRLRSGAKCDPASTGCCTDSCNFAPSTTICRPAVDARCDTAETCPGNSSQCPADIRKDDGASCGSDGLTCASGHCTSRDLQCQQQSQADYNFTTACSPNADQSCSVSCQTPSNAQMCLVLQQQFIDGTSCGYGGRCEGGECKKGSWQDTFRGWYVNNLQVSIPVTIVVAIAILALLYGLLRCLCLPLYARTTGRHVRGAAGPVAKPLRRSNNYGRRRDMRQASTSYPQPPSHSPYQQPHGGSDPSAPPLIHDVGRSNRWVDPYSYNGDRQASANI